MTSIRKILSSFSATCFMLFTSSSESFTFFIRVRNIGDLGLEMSDWSSVSIICPNDKFPERIDTAWLVDRYVGEVLNPGDLFIYRGEISGEEVNQYFGDGCTLIAEITSLDTNEAKSEARIKLLLFNNSVTN